MFNLTYYVNLSKFYNAHMTIIYCYFIYNAFNGVNVHDNKLCYSAAYVYITVSKTHGSYKLS